MYMISSSSLISTTGGGGEGDLSPPSPHSKPPCPQSVPSQYRLMLPVRMRWEQWVVVDVKRESPPASWLVGWDMEPLV